MSDLEWGSEAVPEDEGLDVLKKSYGSGPEDGTPQGQRFTIAADGTVCALTAGDMGYDATHINIPREHILALVEDWPEVTVSKPDQKKAQPEEDDLSERMVAAGMLPLEDILAGNVMGKFSTHVGVTDFPSFLAWAERKHEEYVRMRMPYELGEKGKDDDMYEWVFAHASAFGQVVDHLRKIAPSMEIETVEPEEDEVSP